MMRQPSAICRLITLFIVLGLSLSSGLAESYRPVVSCGNHHTIQFAEFAKDVALSQEKASGSFHTIPNFPIVRQERQWCALASIEMVARYYGFNIDQLQVALEADIPYEEGMSLKAILQYFERLGILMLTIDHHYGGDLESVKDLIDKQIPMIWLHHVPTDKGWLPHAAIVIGYSDVLRRIVVADPAYGHEVILSYKEFLRRWYRTNNLMIIVTSKL